MQPGKGRVSFTALCFASCADMSWLTEHALWIALLLAWPLLWALVRLLGTLGHLRMRIVPRRFAVVSTDAVSHDWRQVLDAMQARLVELGFVRIGSLRSRPSYYTVPRLTGWADLYRHHSGTAFALATPIMSGPGAELGTVEWLGLRADGQLWLGVNWRAHDLLALPPTVTLVDTEQDHMTASWPVFCEKLSTASTPAVDDALLLLKRMNQLAQSEQGEHLVASGQARHAPEGGWRLRWREAYRQTAKTLRGMQRIERQHGPISAAVRAQATPTSAPEAAATAKLRQTADALTFEQSLALQAGIHAGINAWRTFWLSAVLFMLVGGWLFGWLVAALLLAVIALHEAGHWLAMRWLGYRQQTVFFVPGLGGMATGEKPDATPLEKVAVYLAGPVPGILLSLAILAGLLLSQTTPAPWLSQAAVMLLGINLFNLLPIAPLDGGRILETLLFSRLPTLRLVFALGGMACLAALAWFSGDPIIAVVALVLLLSLPWHWRSMQLEQAVRRAPAEEPPTHTTPDTAHTLRRLAGALQQPAFASWNLVQRDQMVRTLLPVVQGRAPRWPEVVLGLALYAAALGLPAAAAWATKQWAPPAALQQLPALLQALDHTFDAEPNADELAAHRIAASHALLRDLDSLPLPDQLERLDEALDLVYGIFHPDVSAHILALRQRGKQLVTHLPVAHPLHAQALLDLADATDTAPERLALLQHLVDTLSAAPGAAAPQLATALVALALEPPENQTAQEQLHLLEQAVQLQQQASGPDTDSNNHLAQPDPSLHRTRRFFASALAANGDITAAEAQLRTNIAELTVSVSRAQAQDPDLMSRWLKALLRDAEQQLAWFFLSHGRPAEAAQLAANAVAHLQADTEELDNWREGQFARIALWAAMDMGDAPATRHHLQVLRAATQGRPPPALTSRADNTPLNWFAAGDQLVAAESLQDTDLRLEAVQALRKHMREDQLNRPHTLCQPALPPQLFQHWKHHAHMRIAAAMRAEGLCGT